VKGAGAAAAPARRGLSRGDTVSPRSLGFVLFVVCMGLLIVRPTELVESLRDAPLYEMTILCGLAISAPRILTQLAGRSLATSPITVCVVGLLPAVALSHMSHGAFGPAVTGTVTFLKVVLSYLFLVAVLNTQGRLRVFLFWLVAFIFALTGLALLQHSGVIDNPALAAHTERVHDDESGEVVGMNVRLCGAGIFANPNDLSRILVVGIVLCLYFIDRGAPVFLRPVWLAAVGVFGYALVLTMSRGGFIALVVSLMVVCVLRFGAARALVLAGLGLPVLAVAVGGRQTDLSTTEGTGQQRIQLWSDGLAALQSSPLFGTGMDTYPELTGGLGAHNSFVHAYTELGFFGGTLFLGAVAGAMWIAVLVHRRHARAVPPELRRLGLYLVAVLAGYAAGMLSSSRCYALPTYLFVGLLVAYLRIVRADALLPRFRVTPRLAVRLALFSAVVLIVFQVYVLTSVRFGARI
jgi:putative inorganic carbon (hco3(-)) transporter